MSSFLSGIDQSAKAKGVPVYTTMRANVAGVCLRCYGPFSAGELIRYDWGEGPVHPMCVRHGS